MTTHYHVGANVPGYTPNDPESTYAHGEIADAIVDMEDRIRDIVEQYSYRDITANVPEWDGEMVHEYARKHGGIDIVIDTDDPFDLGQVVFMSVCEDDDCEIDD